METRYVLCMDLGSLTGRWVPVQAAPVHLAGAECLDMFVHQAINFQADPIPFLYEVSDGLTGYSVGRGETPGAAIRDCEAKLARCGITAFLVLQARAFEAIGGEDWTGAEREVAELSVA